MFTLFNFWRLMFWNLECLEKWGEQEGLINFWVGVFLAGEWNSSQLFRFWNRFWFINMYTIVQVLWYLVVLCVCSDKFNIFMLFDFSVLENTLVSEIVHHVLFLKACVLEWHNNMTLNYWLPKDFFPTCFCYEHLFVYWIIVEIFVN